MKHPLIEFIVLATLLLVCAFQMVGLETLPKVSVGYLLTPNAVYQGF